MKTNNRREYALGFLKLFSEEDASTKNGSKKEVVIGKVSDFPLGVKKNLDAQQICVESLPEGLRVQSSKILNRFYGIKLSSMGEIVVDYSQVWAADEVFSIMTNEPVRLNNN